MFFSHKSKLRSYVLPLISFVIVLQLIAIMVGNATLKATEYVYSGASAPKGTVIIDAGHGGEDSGTVGTNGVLEKDLNLQIAYTVGKYLENAGYTVIYTRTEDKLLYTEEQNIKGMRKIYDLRNRLAFTEEYPDAIFVSIHMNYFSDGRYSGLQVYYGCENPISRELAANIQNEVKTRVQPENTRTIKSGDELYLLKNSLLPTVLIECGFLSNVDECQSLCEKEYQKELSFAIVCGIINTQNTR